MGCEASSRKTRRGRNQTSCNGRIGSFGITDRAYAILIIDSSIKRDDSRLFQGYSHEQPYDREEMTDHGKEESEGEEASGSEGKARSCQEGRRQESREEESEEGEQGEGCNEGEEGKEGGFEEGGSKEVGSEEGACEGGTAGKGCIGSEESDGTAEARGSGRTAPYAGTGSHAEQRLRTRAPALAQHGSFRLDGDRRGSVARINREGMRAALPSRWHDACIVPAQSLTLRAATRVRRHGLT